MWQRNGCTFANLSDETLNCRIGQSILDRQAQQGGAKGIDQLSRDLRAEFPDLKGFSPTNLKYMRSFAQAYPDFQTGQQLVDHLPWGIW